MASTYIILNRSLLAVAVLVLVLSQVQCRSKTKKHTKRDPSGDGPSGDGESGDGPSGNGPSGDGPSGDESGCDDNVDNRMGKCIMPYIEKYAGHLHNPQEMIKQFYKTTFDDHCSESNRAWFCALHELGKDCGDQPGRRADLETVLLIAGNLRRTICNSSEETFRQLYDCLSDETNALKFIVSLGKCAGFRPFQVCTTTSQERTLFQMEYMANCLGIAITDSCGGSLGYVVPDAIVDSMAPVFEALGCVDARYRPEEESKRDYSEKFHRSFSNNILNNFFTF